MTKTKIPTIRDCYHCDGMKKKCQRRPSEPTRPYELCQIYEIIDDDLIKIREGDYENVTFPTLIDYVNNPAINGFGEVEI